jgi:hypothetical protein
VGRVFSRKTRWLAFIAGLLGAIAGSISMTPLFGLMYAPALIVGAIAQARFPRVGKALMLIGALVLSAWVIPVGSAILLNSRNMLSHYHDFNIVAITLLWSAVLVSQVWCDVLLVIESMRMHQAQRLAARVEL